MAQLALNNNHSFIMISSETRWPDGVELFKQPHFVHMGQTIWPPEAIQDSDWSNTKKNIPWKYMANKNTDYFFLFKTGKETVFSKTNSFTGSDSKIIFRNDDMKANFWLAEIKHFANESNCY